jgi:hypothetical protein
MNQPNPRAIHYTQLPDPPPDDDGLAREWAVYRRELPRLLAEGQEGRFVLIKGDTLHGVWDELWDAVREGRKHYGRGPFLVHQIQEWEPVLRQSYA